MSRPLFFGETIGFRPIGIQEFPQQRRSSFWALRTSLMAGNGLTELPVAAGSTPRSRGNHPAVREIHKNAWLKRQTSTEKKGTPFSKKVEKFWVVFCVHDDSEAFLEFYSEPKMGTIHKPMSAISLNTCLHVSPSIIGQENEYEFAVTLQSEVIRLVAQNWEQMIEWVESLQGKLREMNILSPKDNLYSKLPETKPGTGASTRDPNSPLPPTPSSLVGLRFPNQNIRPELLHRILEARVRSDEAQLSNLPSRLSVNGNSAVASSTGIQNPGVMAEREESSSRGNRPSNSNPAADYDTVFVNATSAQRSSSSSMSVESNQEQPQQHSKRKPQISVRVSVDVNSSHRNGSGRTDHHHHHNHHHKNHHHHHRHSNSSSTSVASASTTVVVVGNGDIRTHTASSDSRSRGRKEPSANVSVRCISTVINGSMGQNEEEQQCNSNRNEGHATASSPGENVSSEVTNESSMSRALEALNNICQVNPATTTTSKSRLDGGSSSNLKKSAFSENIYEHIYLPDRQQNGEGTRNGSKPSNRNHKARSHNAERRNRAHRSSSEMSPDEENHQQFEGELESNGRRLGNSNGGGGSSSQRSSSVGRIDVPSSSTRLEAKRDISRRNGHNSNSDQIRAVGNSTFFSDTDSSSSQVAPIDVLIGTRAGGYMLRRNESSIEGGNSDGSENDNQSSDATNSTPTSSHIPLKEQQVIHLQTEINHPSGVRITLRKKDCLNSIAFVDYLGAVWIAGWKQTQFPVLHYAFHIGDQILKVADVTVQSSVEASRAIKTVSSTQVEFIIRRLPYGRVFALKRSRDGEPLGLVAEGGSGEISEVLPDGLAARYGLPPKGLSLDGQTPANWFLTEINHRPLSLLSKDENEVKDRLNAVGKEISILVQPADLVKHLRKNLKSYKGFKEYVVG